MPHVLVPPVMATGARKGAEAMAIGKIGRRALCLAMLAGACCAGTAAAQSDRYMDNYTGWWWLLGVGSAEITNRINAGFRPFDIERTAPNTYNAVFVQNSGVFAKSNFDVYYAQTPANLINLYNANNQRILDLEVFDNAGSTAISAVAISNTGADAAGWGWLYNTNP